MESENTAIIRARDVMHTQMVSIDGMATAREAAAKMRSEKVFSLLVKKRHADDAWGLVIVQDFIKGVIIPGRSPSEVNVYEIMTKPTLTLDPKMNVKYAIRLLTRLGHRRALVTSENGLLGLVTLRYLVLSYADPEK